MVSNDKGPLHSCSVLMFLFVFCFFVVVVFLFVCFFVVFFFVGFFFSSNLFKKINYLLVMPKTRKRYIFLYFSQNTMLSQKRRTGFKLIA